MYLRLRGVERLREVDEVLELLGDGEWHNLDEVASILEVSGVKVGLIASFLNKYGLISLRSGVKAKLTKRQQQFMKRIKWIEHAEKEKL